MATHYILVKIEGAASDAKPYFEEILSNLEFERDSDTLPIEGNISVVSLPTLAEDLQLLQRSCVDSTDTIECAAALNNYAGALLEVLDISEPLDSADGESDLSRFTLRNQPPIATKEGTRT